MPGWVGTAASPSASRRKERTTRAGAALSPEKGSAPGPRSPGAPQKRGRQGKPQQPRGPRGGGGGPLGPTNFNVSNPQHTYQRGHSAIMAPYSPYHKGGGPHLQPP